MLWRGGAVVLFSYFIVVVINIVYNSLFQLLKRLKRLLITVKHFRFQNPKEGLHHTIVWAVTPYVTWMLELLTLLGTDDKNRVGIASLGHYGESYSRSASL